MKSSSQSRKQFHQNKRARKTKGALSGPRLSTNATTHQVKNLAMAVANPHTATNKQMPNLVQFQSAKLKTK